MINGIKDIRIKNVKGIEDRTFELNIIPNKPSILVAQNGFGKSSFATAFNSLNANRIDLDKDNYHKNDEGNEPYISITLVQDSVETLLEADSGNNSINSEINIVVINSRLKAKVGGIFGQRRPSASINLENITLVKTIPRIVKFNYSIRTQKTDFGDNGKILLTIQPLLDSKIIIKHLFYNITVLEKAIQPLNQRGIQNFIDSVNERSGSDEVIKQWIIDNKIEELISIEPLEQLKNILQSYDLSFTSLSDYYLSAIQVINLYKTDKDNYKKASKYLIYQLEKEEYITLFEDFNSTWIEVKPRVKSGSLILDFPKVHSISNGQRDILNFIALLQQAKNKFNKQNCLLIIDEVFDYLDEGNLVAVQYYISNFIEKLKSEGKYFYPLILTHLNPYHFKNFTFSKQKVYFLNEIRYGINQHFKKLIQNRDDSSIKDDIAKHHFHFHTNIINIRDKFIALSLKETWGENTLFYNHINDEIQKYLTDEDYCPFSVCCALRVVIEKNIYAKLSSETKTIFLDTKGTKKKLDVAVDSGVEVKEIYYLLGVIYNDGLHWSDKVDKTIPIITNLENITIKNMIKKVLET